MSASMLRRVVFVVSLAAAAVVLANWWRQRHEGAAEVDQPEWPAWPESPSPSPVTSPAAWVTGSDGAAPDGYPIKLNATSGIFHVPGGRFYERTTADRWYATADAAVADGYRQSKT